MAVLALTLGACSKSFLETKPTDYIAESDAFTTTTNALAALNGIHRAMYMQYSNQDEGGQGTIMIDMDMLGEDLVMTAAGNGWFNTTYQWLSHRNVNSNLNYYVYRFYYKIIANANMIITNIDKASGPDADKRMIKGQALAYRAWAHFNLVQIFAKRYDATIKPNSQLGIPLLLTNTTVGQPRAIVEDVYTQINKDLDDAITNLTGATARANKSHLNLSVANGLKARVALTMQDWTNAAKYALAARTGYTPMTATEYTSGFNNYNLGEWMWGSTVIPDQTTYFYSFFAYMSVNFSSTNIRSDPKAINSALYNLIPATDIRKQLWDPTGTAYTFLASTFVKKPYMNQKFWAVATGDSRGDICYMRAAEMYLIEAEARARLSDATAADVLYQLVSKRNPSYVKSTSTGTTLVNEILLQRRMELWGEGFRYFDLKRTNSALDRNGANHQAALCNIFTMAAGDVKWEFLIPQSEVNANPAMVQNPL